MREFKFRIWDNLKKEWLTNKQVFRISIANDSTGNLIKDNEIYFKQDSQGYIIQQFTGLKDKNGREIYEGDILKNEYLKKYVTTWNSSIGSWIFVFKDNGGSWSVNYGEMPSDVEIIGNIFENE